MSTLHATSHCSPFRPVQISCVCVCVCVCCCSLCSSFQFYHPPLKAVISLLQKYWVGVGVSVGVGVRTWLCVSAVIPPLWHHSAHCMLSRLQEYIHSELNSGYECRMSCGVMWCHVMSCDVMWCHVMSCEAPPLQWCLVLCCSITYHWQVTVYYADTIKAWVARKSACRNTWKQR